MTDVILYRPDANESYPDATDIKIEYGVLSFCWRPSSTSFNSKKITATVPFMIEDSVEGNNS